MFGKTRRTRLYITPKIASVSLLYIWLIDHDLTANVYTVCASLMAEMKNEIEEKLFLSRSEVRGHWHSG